MKVREETNTRRARRGRLPVGTAWKLGLQSYLRHPVRAAVSALLSAIAFTLVGVSATIGRGDIAKTEFRIMRENGVQSAVLKSDAGTGVAMRWTEAERAFVQSDLGGPVFPVVSGDCSVDNLNEGDSVYTSAQPVGFTSAEEAEGVFSVSGALPAREGEIGVTRFLAEIFAENGLETEERTEYFDSPEALIGAPLVVNGETFRITAVIDTGFSGGQYAPLKETGEEALPEASEQLASRFATEISFSAHALLFLPDLSALADEDSIAPEYASLSLGDNFRKELLKIEKDTGEVPVVRVSDETGAILPASVLPALLGKIPAEGDLSGIYETLGEAFSAMFAEYFSERAEEYYALAAAEGYTGTPEEYAEGVLSGITPEYGPGRGEMYFDFYAEYSSDFPLSEGGRCAVSEKRSEKEYVFPIAGFYPDETGFSILLSPQVYEEVYREIGGVYDFLAAGTAVGERAAVGYLGGKTVGNFTFFLFNYVKEELDSQAELFGSIAKGAAVFSGIFGVFAVLLYVNFMMQSVRDRYSSVAVLRALGCGRGGVFGIFARECCVFGLGVLALSGLGMAAAIAAADTVLLAADGAVFALLAAGIALISLCAGGLSALSLKDEKLLEFMRE